MALLEDLYRDMYELTREHCGCRPGVYRCCEARYCQVARSFAKEKYDVDLQDTGHAIPFMGSYGCVVDPHLRPICTLHACCIAWADHAGFPGDPERTVKYFELRKLILAEAKRQDKMPEGI